MALACRNLRLAYGSRSVLQGLSLSLRSAEIYALLGLGGCGKSTLFRVLVGLEPAEGEVTFDGRSLADLRGVERTQFHTQVAMTFQANALFDGLSTADNVRFPLRELIAESREARERRVHHALEQVELGDASDRPVTALSGGMQKRLAIARALALQPKVALLDEPTAGLDPLTSRTILELVRRARDEQGVGVCLAMTDPVAALAVADRVGLMGQGRILFEGTAAEFRRAGEGAVEQFLTGAAEGPLTEGL